MIIDQLQKLQYIKPYCYLFSFRQLIGLIVRNWKK